MKNFKVEKINTPFTNWHPSFKVITETYKPLSFICSPIGCGQLMMQNWSILSKDTLKDVLSDLLNSIKETRSYKGFNSLDVGSIITVAGDNIFHSKSKEENYNCLLELGFKLISEYENPRHAAGYKQKLLIYKF